MTELPEAFKELLAWQEARDRERHLRNLTSMIATGTRAPPVPYQEQKKGRPENKGEISSPLKGESKATNLPLIPTADRPEEYHYITTPEGLEKALAALAGAEFIALDTETTGLDPLTEKIRLLQMAAPEGPAYVVDFFEVPPASCPGLADLLAGPTPKTLHNAKFDMAFLAQAGLPISGPVFDTFLAAQLLGARKWEANLASVVKTYLKRSLSKEMQASKWSTPTLVPDQIYYAALDALILVELRPVLMARLKAARLGKVAKLEFSCLPAVVEMETTGITLDRERWETLADQQEKDKQAAEERARPLLPGVNLNSSSQLLSALKGLGLDLEDTKEETLLPLAEKHPVAQALLDYRKASKMLSTFGRAYPKHVHPLTGRIHADYWQLGAATGRMSCSRPNLQQVPHDLEIRACFIAPPGSCLVLADYSQIELRVMAQLSQDERMLGAYRAGEDLHRLTASLITGIPLDEVDKRQRQAAKAVNFGLIYAMGADGLRKYSKASYGVPMPLKEAKEFREKFFKGYPGIATWHQRMAGQRETRTLSGRRRVWTEARPRVTEIYNAPVQGTAADILKQALAWLPGRLSPLGAKILAVVHDEVIVEVREDRAEEARAVVQATMEEAGALYLPDVPVLAEAKIAQNWGEK